MRTLIDIFAQIFRTLWAHKLRSFLTMFGIAWGIGSLLLLVGLGEGFRSGNKREMEEFGKDIMFLFPGRAPVVEGSMRSARNYMLTYQDYLDIRSAPYIRNASPVLTRDDVRAVSEFASASGQITGIEPQYNEIRFLPLKQGRWINNLDGTQKRNVIVLGDEMTRNLFTGRPALGATIVLNGIRFEVIGTLRRVGRGDNNSTNARVVVASADAPESANHLETNPIEHDGCAQRWTSRKEIARHFVAQDDHVALLSAVQIVDPT